MSDETPHQLHAYVGGGGAKGNLGGLLLMNAVQGGVLTEFVFH